MRGGRATPSAEGTFSVILAIDALILRHGLPPLVRVAALPLRLQQGDQPLLHQVLLQVRITLGEARRREPHLPLESRPAPLEPPAPPPRAAHAATLSVRARPSCLVAGRDHQRAG